jgi:uncharacterized protein GlcG (DUF336 family)
MFCQIRLLMFTTAVLAGFVVASERVPITLPVPINTPKPNDVPALTVDEVNTVIAQAVGYLQSINLAGVVAVSDREGHILAIYRMTKSSGIDPRINEQATAKARTASFFESNQDAFSTRTAQFIVQNHFPPGIRFVDAGPLFGVPFSNFPNSDVQLQAPPFIVFINGLNAPATSGLLPALPPGNSNNRPVNQPLVITPLTDDPGGLALYKNQKACGGVGVEIDGFGVLAQGIPDKGVTRTDIAKSKQINEETAALAASRGFLPPRDILGSQILINGFRFKYLNVKMPRSTAVPVASLSTLGAFEPYFDTDGSERSPDGTAISNAYARTYGVLPLAGLTTNANDAFGSLASPAVVLSAARGTPTQEFPRRGWVPRFPPRDSPLGLITQADVVQLVQQSANAAEIVRAAIRNPNGVPERVWISVVDTAGNICGSFRTDDATVFSFDVHVQKARTAAFFSNNQVGFTSRAIGFMAQTSYPPGVQNTPAGPISGLMPDKPGNVSAGSLGDPPSDGAGRLTEIAQLLVDDNFNGVLNVPAVAAAPATLGDKVSAVVQLLARRLPRIRDGRISPLQAAITVDLTLLRLRGGGQPTPRTDIPNGITIFAGGVPIYKNGILVGGLGVSGGGIDQDDIIAFLGQKGFDPPSGVRCDSASPDNIVLALQQATTKLKAQFPNLTNGKDAVLDVISNRLSNGGRVLEGLRLPYIKQPRSPFRK